MTIAPSTRVQRRSAAALSTLLVLIVVIGAFVVSFTVLRDLAARSGIPAEVAWIWPVIVDGTMAAASVQLVAVPRRRIHSTLTLVLFALASVTGNVAHIVIAPSDPVPTAIAIFVAAVPPVGLLMTVEMLVAIVPRSAEEQAAAAVAEESEPADQALTVTGHADQHPVTVADPDPVTVDTAPITQPVTVPSLIEPISHAPVTLTAPPDQLTVVTDTEQSPSEHSSEREPVMDEVAANPDLVASTADYGGQHEQPNVPTLRAVERLPEDADEQVEWIIQRAKRGDDVSRKTLLETLTDAGVDISDSTVGRRLRTAREQAPELFDKATA